MGRSKVALIISIVCGLILFAFNNCGSDVQFTDAESDDGVSQSSSGADNLDDEVPATEEQIEDVVVNLTEDDLAVAIPVSELENDPSLFEKYKCDASSILVCHFPENVSNAGENCIGIKAVYSHFDHVREYVKDGEVRSVFDYLGPCRFEL